MAGNTKVSFAIALFLWLGTTVAAYAYSYDEIVLMVRAEEKVFGQTDYGKSLDQRLEALELKVLGAPKTGSDSVRLTRICRSLGLVSEEAAISPAPFSVLVTPKQKAQSKKEQKKIASVSAPATTGKPSTNATPAIGTAPAASSDKLAAKTAKIKAKKLDSKTGKASASAATAPAQTSALAQEASTQDLQNKEAEASKPASSLGAFLIAIVLGIVAISFGMVTYLLLKVKNDVAQPFTSGYELESEEDRQADAGEEANSKTGWNFRNLEQRADIASETVTRAIEQADSAQTLFETGHTTINPEMEKSSVSVAYQTWAPPPAALQTYENTHSGIEVSNSPVDLLLTLQTQEADQAANSFAVSDFVQEPKFYATGSEFLEQEQNHPELPASIEHQHEAISEQIDKSYDSNDELADTLHINEYLEQWHEQNANDQRIFISDEIIGSSLAPIPEIKETVQAQAQKKTIHEDSSSPMPASNNPEFAFLLQSLNEDQLNNILQAYSTDEIAADTDPAEDFALLCEMDSYNPFAKSSTEERQDQSLPQAEPPQFDVPVAPKFMTVSSWKDKEAHHGHTNIQATKNSEEAFLLNNINCEISGNHEIASSRDINVLSDSPVAAADEMGLSSADIILQLEKINLENLVQQTFALPDDGESYRTLAQLLIDAAQQAKTPSQYAKSKRVPLYAKRVFATRTDEGTNLEDKLRELFSEKV